VVNRWMTETDPWPTRHSVKKEVVLASDYDALAARLAEAERRIGGLEAWLAEYDPERRCPYWITQRAADSADEDPTPWCNQCGARKQAQCKCGPIAENE
jgi:hypothetical protein